MAHRGSFQERSARSIFVGNISYDVNEQEVRQILSTIGQVVNFRIVHDRDTGRPKGFGFCEFAEVSSVDMAIRNLNGYELHGRPLRIDSATGADKNMDEFQQILSGMSGPVGPIQVQQNGNNQLSEAQQPQEHNPYGPAPEPGKAPESIARVVSSYPPEKMFQLMQEMKQMVNTNPQLARQMLVDNPQLAYALLQAQVVMRVVDPKVAYSMLHRENPSTTPFHQQQGVAPPSSTGPSGGLSQLPPVQQGISPGSQGAFGQPQMGIVGPAPGMHGMGGGQSGQGGPFSQHMQQSGPQFSGQLPMFRGPPPVHGMPPGMHPNISVPPPGMMLSHQPPIMMQHQQQAPVLSTGTHQSDDVDDEETQAQMLVKVLQLTDEQIFMLPPEDRNKVVELRNQLRQQVSS